MRIGKFMTKKKLREMTKLFGWSIYFKELTAQKKHSPESISRYQVTRRKPSDTYCLHSHDCCGKWYRTEHKIFPFLIHTSLWRNI